MAFRWNQRYRHLKRYRQIGEVLLRHGFGYFLQQLDLTHILPLRKRIRSLQPVQQTMPPAGRIRKVLEDLGPTFVKFGQVLSTRPDLLPTEFVKELEKLQDRVPPVAFPEIKEQVEKELGAPIAEVFEVFHSEPLAAASIGQVHYAMLADGEEVVVKVQRPRIRNTIETDLEIMYGLAGMLRDQINTSHLDPVAVVDEFRRTIRKELDYTKEARNIERFHANFQDDPRIVIPRVKSELSTERLLTMEYVRGVKVSQVEVLEHQGHDLPALMNTLAECFMKQVFEDGFFHADPHPGNLMVLNGGRLAFVDFGMVGRVDEPTMQGLARMLVAITKRNVDEVILVLQELDALHGKPTRELRSDVIEMIDMHYGRTLKELNFSQIFEDLLELVHRHPVSLPTNLLFLAKAMVTVEGVGSALWSDFNVMEVAEPFATQWMEKQYSVKSIGERTVSYAKDWNRLIRKLPGELETTMQLINEGELEIRFRHEGLEKLTNRLDVVSNRLTFGVIIGSIVIGSSFMVQLDRGPTFLQIPVFGLAGFVLAGFMGLWLLVAILKSGRI